MSLIVPAVARAGQEQTSSKAARLYAEERWAMLVREFPDSPSLSSEVEYYRGMALAKLGRWPEARHALEEGRKKNPRDERFPLELAGIAFRQEKYGEAKHNLRAALRLAPKDEYAEQFLGTIFFLEHNLDAALECWNSIGKPRIQSVQMDPALRVDPGLLSRAFAFSPASVLNLDDLRTTRARLNLMGIFPRYRFALVPIENAAEKDPFDLKFSAVESDGWGLNRWEGLLIPLRGLPYETVYFDGYNLGRSATNVTSMIRWDDQKRRAFVTFSSLLSREPRWRYEVFADARNENWNLSRTFHEPGPPPTDLNLRRAQAGADIRSAVNGRWSWMAGADIVWRDLRDFSSTAQSQAAEFSGGTSLEARLGTNYLLMDRPQRRFTLASSFSAQLGKFFGHSSGRYHRLEATLAGTWFPRAQTDDYRISEQLHLGEAGGQLPLDELFMLGLERDNNLPLRAHIGTFDGRKGSAPLGRRYFLSNWEIDKSIYSNAWLDVKLAPFLDNGKITDAGGAFGDPNWLWDAGGELKVRVLGGVTVVLTYGKNLRTGQNTFYASTLR